jgi:SSS family solute:Na+ symporter
MNGALIGIGCAVVLALGLGFLARRGRQMGLEQWTVAGRSFGAPLVFLLLAGEIYTTFTFLGASGYAYGRGGPTYYILAYGVVGYCLSYFLLPPIWRYAKEHALYSQSDFFVRKYDSPALGILVSLVSIIALVPYLVLQFKGLGIIVEIAGYGAISSTAAIWIGAAVATSYVMVSGVRGSAWTAVAKDIMIVLVVVFLGVYFPLRYYGGLAPMFAAIEEAKPGFLALPERGESVWWFSSTVLLSALGFYMWPHAFGSIYTARNPRVLRFNAIILPLYQLILVFVFCAGFAAILQVPGLTGPNVDLALFRLSVKSFDPWLVGVIGAAGVLTAIVPCSMILMTAATLLANNVYRVARRSADDAHVVSVAKALVPVIALVAVLFTLEGGQTIVALLLLGYALVIQLFPAFVCSLPARRWVTRAGAASGMLSGIATVAAIALTHTTIGTLFPTLPVGIKEINVGIVALAVNVAVMLSVTAAARLAPAGAS